MLNVFRRLFVPLRFFSVALCLLLSVIWPANADSSVNTDEAVVRSAMIFNLLKFTKWPDTMPADATLHICAVDASASLVTALQPLEKRSAGQHALATKTASAKDISTCDVVVTDAMQTSNTLNQIQDRSILTIGEAGFIDRGGMIGITVIDNRVRFEINLEAMKRSGISLPSQVLQLAVRTR